METSLVSRRFLVSLALIAIVATVSVAATVPQAKSQTIITDVYHISGTLPRYVHTGPRPNSIGTLYTPQVWVSGSCVDYGPYNDNNGWAPWYIGVDLTWSPSSQPVDVILISGGLGGSYSTPITLKGGSGSAVLYIPSNSPPFYIQLSTLAYSNPSTVTYSGTITVVYMSY
jgi:hypothetical protein